jgi:hypothetical protein
MGVIKKLFKAVVINAIHIAIAYGIAMVAGPQAGAAYYMSAVSYYASREMMPKPGVSPQSKRGYEVTKTGSTISHQIIYGKMKVAGARIFDGTTGTVVVL